MSTILPAWPHAIFAVLEPGVTIIGALITLFDPRFPVAAQHPDVQTPQVLPADTQMITQQLGNMYMFLAVVAVGILYSTSEPRIVRNYLGSLVLADLVHLYLTYLGLGQAIFFNIARWNPMTWGNIGVTTFFMLNRISYILGLFGPAKVPRSTKKSQ